MWVFVSHHSLKTGAELFRPALSSGSVKEIDRLGYQAFKNIYCDQYIWVKLSECGGPRWWQSNDWKRWKINMFIYLVCKVMWILVLKQILLRLGRAFLSKRSISNYFIFLPKFSLLLKPCQWDISIQVGENISYRRNSLKLMTNSSQFSLDSPIY